MEYNYSAPNNVKTEYFLQVYVYSAPSKIPNSSFKAIFSTLKTGKFEFDPFACPLALSDG